MNVLIKTVLPILISGLSLQAAAAEKYLQYKYNHSVTIVISSAACPFPQVKDEYKLTVVAFRVDGQKLAGCYKKLDENFIEIQWHKGDKTIIPANAFLQPDSITPLPAPAPTL